MIAAPRTVRAGKSLTRIENERAEAADAPEWLRALFGGGGVDEEDRETVRTIGVEAGSVGIECELVSPRSAAARTVYVVIPPEQVLAVLKLCRRAAAAQRSRPMEETRGTTC